MSAERRRQDVGTCEEVALSASFLTSILLDEEHWLSGKDGSVCILPILPSVRNNPSCMIR